MAGGGWGEDKNDLSYHQGIAGEARKIAGRERAQNMDDKLSRPGAFSNPGGDQLRCQVLAASGAASPEASPLPRGGSVSAL